MNTGELTLLVWLGSLAAGFLGALTGLGGGVVVVPMLTLLFGVDIRYAIGASLVSVIATSSGRPRRTSRKATPTCASAFFWRSPRRSARWPALRWRRTCRPATVAVTFGVVLAASATIVPAPPPCGRERPRRPTRWLHACGSTERIPARAARSSTRSAAFPADSA